MPYTEHQLHCLSAMGMVAWRLREDGAASPAPVVAPSTIVPTTAATAPPAAVPLEPSAEPTPAAMPHEPAALGGWLAAQPLAPFVYKGRRLTRVGRSDAPLLVVVERAADEPRVENDEAFATLPLAGPAAVLFEAMLGSIGLARHDTFQCALAVAPASSAGGQGADTVGAAAGAGRRATLVLLQGLAEGLDAAACRLPDEAPGDAAWCLPHPALLLAHPLRKREAWDVLKALRRHLSVGP